MSLIIDIVLAMAVIFLFYSLNRKEKLLNWKISQLLQEIKTLKKRGK